MKIKLHNTLARKIEEFKPLRSGFVGMYTCGMTVYDHTHIGHMRTYVNTDCLRRMFEYNGLKVRQVENVTDVGHLFGDRDMGKDKMEVAAKKAKKTAWDIAKMYEKEFFETMEALNVKKPTIVCRATEHIKEMIDLVKKIEKKGFTYKTSDGIYFDTARIRDYNQLSGMPLEKLKEGARIEPNPEKHNPTDFALWKFSPKKGPRRQMEWDSPWAPPGVRGKVKGFPGWHIECSAMGMKYLGKEIDIHTGGEDHITIHHPNERAQNIAATGHPVVNFWFHNAFLMVEGGKMSKSLGNFFWMKDIKERGFDPLALRYLFLTAHYRSKLNFTWKSLNGAQKALNKLRQQVVGWKTGKKRIPGFEKKFLQAINNDLDMPKALAITWNLLKSNYPDTAKKATLLKVDQVLGLRLASYKVAEPSSEVKKLIGKREDLRKQKKWEEADEMRKKVEKLGWIIEDTKKGPKLKTTEQI